MRTVNPEQHARRRAAIVAAAAEEFAAHGPDGTTTAAVCRRAGIGSGTLFHYFPTKRALFHAVFADDLPRITALCDRALAEPDPGTGLDLLLDHLTAEVADPLAPGLAAAAVFQAGRDAEFAAVLAANDAHLDRALTTLLQRNAERGRPAAFPPARAARWIRNAVDAAHLADAPAGRERSRTAAELRRILTWLVRAR